MNNKLPEIACIKIYIMLLMFTEFVATLPIEDLCFGYDIN